MLYSRPIPALRTMIARRAATRAHAVMCTLAGMLAVVCALAFGFVACCAFSLPLTLGSIPAALACLMAAGVAYDAAKEG